MVVVLCLLVFSSHTLSTYLPALDTYQTELNHVIRPVVSTVASGRRTLIEDSDFSTSPCLKGEMNVDLPLQIFNPMTMTRFGTYWDLALGFSRVLLLDNR